MILSRYIAIAAALFAGILLGGAISGIAGRPYPEVIPALILEATILTGIAIHIARKAK